MNKDRKNRVAALARSRGDRAAGLILGDQQLTQFQETGETNAYVGVPPFELAVQTRNHIADTLGLARENVIIIGLEDDTPVVGFRAVAA